MKAYFQIDNYFKQIKMASYLFELVMRKMQFLYSRPCMCFFAQVQDADLIMTKQEFP